MATITSVGSGAWGTAGTWDAGVPADGDTVIIASGHTVEFNVDQSAWTTGINGLTITGTLSLTRTTGTYYMMVKAAATIAGAGTFDCGTLASPIPFAAKHTITGGGGATAEDVRIEMDANSTKLAAILADTNELQADWVNGGRLDLILDAAGSAGDPWTTALPGAYGAGTAGKIIGDNINAPIATVDTVVDAIKTVVDDIHDTDLPAVKSDTAAILEDTGTTLDTLIKDIPTNAELATALGTADDATLAAIAGLDTKIDTIDNFLDTEIAAILEDTGTTLPATLTTIEGKVDAVDNYVDTEVAAIKSVVDDILVDTGTTLDALVKDIPTTAELTALVVGADADTLETLSDQLDLLTTIPGSLAWDYTITDGSSVPIPDVLVWITSDIGGSSVIARGITNASGVASFMLDPGTVYVWCYKYGWSFSNPDTEVVS